MATTSEIVKKLNLEPLPEGGFFAQTFRDTSVILSKSQLPSRFKVDRPVSTSIYSLMPAGSFSPLHRMPTAETWHFYLGDPLSVVELHEDGSLKMTCLGPDVLSDDQYLQYTSPPNVWFGSFPTNDIEFSGDMKAVKKPARDSEKHFSLLGCTCAPGWQFEDLELAKRSGLIARFPDHESLISLLTNPE